MTITVQVGDKSLEFPDGTTHEVINSTVKKLANPQAQLPADNGSQKKPVPYVPSGERMGEQEPPTGLEMAGRGVADLTEGLQQGYLMFKDAVTGGKEGEEFTRQKSEEERLYQRGRGPEAGADLGRFGGTAAMTLPLMAVKAATTLPKQVAQGMGLGGATGAAMFAGEDTSKLEQGAAGAAVGAAIPLAMAGGAKVLKTGYHGLIEPWLNPAAIKGRAYLEAAGDKTKQIIDLLTKNKQIVKGSQPVAGEAAAPAGRAEFSALQESAAKVKPSDYLARNDAQNAARVGAIEEFAGNPAKLEAAKATREAAAGPSYEAGKAAVRADTNVKTPAWKELTEHPSVSSAIKRAEKEILERTGKEIKLTGSGHKLTGDEAQKIKLALDDQIKLYPKSAADTNELSAMKDSRKAFIGWMEKEFPDLAKGRTAYKDNSAPINQMEVGTELERKLVPALREDGKQRGTVFAGAVRDSASTIKKATGEPRFQELEDVLTSRQLQNVHGVQDDLARSDRHLDMARRGGKAAPNAVDLATANLEREVGGKVPNILHRGAMLANAVITRMEGKVNRKLAAEMAAEMLNPPKVGEALAAAQAREAYNKMLSEHILRAQRPAIAAGAIGVAGNQGE